MNRKAVDGRILLGIGIGMVLTCILLRPLLGRKPSAAEIEARARSMGMIYEEEVRALPEEDGEGKKSK